MPNDSGNIGVLAGFIGSLEKTISPMLTVVDPIEEARPGTGIPIKYPRAGGTSINEPTVVGPGTINTIPRWLTTSTIGNSALRQVGGALIVGADDVGATTAAPGTPLRIDGDMLIGGTQGGLWFRDRTDPLAVAKQWALYNYGGALRLFSMTNNSDEFWVDGTATQFRRYLAQMGTLGEADIMRVYRSGGYRIGLLHAVRTNDGADVLQINGASLSLEKGLMFKDTRAVASAPGAYSNSIGFDFKTAASCGAIGGSFCGVMHAAPWGDDSGGGVHQLMFSDTGVLYHRFGDRTVGWVGTRYIPRMSYGTANPNTAGVQGYTGDLYLQI